VLLIVGALLRGLSAAHAASYTFTTIDVPGALHTIAFGINDRGQIVGCCDGTQSFLLEDGQFTPLDVPGLAVGINKQGQIVGVYQDASGTYGFLLSGGTVTPIDVPESYGTYAYGINGQGHIVGVYIDANGLQHGFLAMPPKK
jgi:uncharacterized membrane protein